MRKSLCSARLVSPLVALPLVKLWCEISTHCVGVFYFPHICKVQRRHGNLPFLLWFPSNIITREWMSCDIFVRFIVFGNTPTRVNCLLRWRMRCAQIFSHINPIISYGVHECFHGKIWISWSRYSTQIFSHIDVINCFAANRINQGMNVAPLIRSGNRMNRCNLVVTHHVPLTGRGVSCCTANLAIRRYVLPWMNEKRGARAKHQWAEKVIVEQ